MESDAASAVALMENGHSFLLEFNFPHKIQKRNHTHTSMVKKGMTQWYSGPKATGINKQSNALPSKWMFLSNLHWQGALESTFWYQITRTDKNTGCTRECLIAKTHCAHPRALATSAELKSPLNLPKHKRQSTKRRKSHIAKRVTFYPVMLTVNGGENLAAAIHGRANTLRDPSDK